MKIWWQIDFWFILKFVLSWTRYWWLEHDGFCQERLSTVEQKDYGLHDKHRAHSQSHSLAFYPSFLRSHSLLSALIFEFHLHLSVQRSRNHCDDYQFMYHWATWFSYFTATGRIEFTSAPNWIETGFLYKTNFLILDHFTSALMSACLCLCVLYGINLLNKPYPLHNEARPATHFQQSLFMSFAFAP